MQHLSLKYEMELRKIIVKNNNETSIKTVL